MKLLVISDIDDLHWRGGTGQADLILSCGDVADQLILEAAEAYHCPTVFAVRGNHDYNHQQEFPEPIVDLHMATRQFNGLTFGGFNGAWQYKPRGHYLYSQSEVCELMSPFPPVDILISHNSPRGVHDRDDGLHTGFDGLVNYLIEHKPQYLLHGHQHINRETQCDGTRVICVYGWREMEI